MSRQVRDLHQPALLMHSRDDPITSASATHDVARYWPGAQWVPLDGLGHTRILRDPQVIKRIRRFAQAPLV